MHAAPSIVRHAERPVFLHVLEHAIDRDAGPTRDHLRDVIGGDGLLDHRAFALARFHRLQPLLDLRDAAIGDFAGALILAAALRIGEFDLRNWSSWFLSFCASDSFSFSDFQRAVRSADCFCAPETKTRIAAVGRESASPTAKSGQPIPAR